nr:Gfo/Idh/MocA family oxidoreductase [Candidatus Sigynarchaeota archaeon]
MEKKLSIGIVGLGQFGKGFVPIFKAHPIVGRVAVCDIDKKKLETVAKEYKIQETYPDLDAICKSDLDALAIITQHWLHAPQAIQAMEAGKHVYSAVPVITPRSGRSSEIYDWCEKIIATCKKTGLKYMLGETSYFRPEVQYAMAKHAKHEFGHISLVEAEYLHDTLLPASNLIKVMMARTGLSEQEVYKLGGGVPMHYVTHSASVPVAITGAHATEVSCFGYAMPGDNYFRQDSEASNVFCNEIATFMMSDGSIGRVIEGRRVGHVGREALVRVLGTKASMEVTLKGAIWSDMKRFELVDVECRPKLPKPLGKFSGHGGSHPYLVDEFVRSIVEGHQPKTNAWEAARYAAIGAAAHDSALQGGKLVKVPDWGDAPK